MLVDFQTTRATGISGAGSSCRNSLELPGVGAFIPERLGGDRLRHPGLRGQLCASRRRRVTSARRAEPRGGPRSPLMAGPSRHTGYVVSQRIRKRVEEIFGWMDRGRIPADPLPGIGPVLVWRGTWWPRRLQPGSDGQAAGAGSGNSTRMRALTAG